PSRSESFGQVYVEAMACGVPVVATRSGGPPSYLNTDPAHPNGWLVDPDDEDGLVDVLVTALTDDSARSVRGDNAYRDVRARFSWTASAQVFSQVYDEMLRE